MRKSRGIVPIAGSIRRSFIHKLASSMHERIARHRVYKHGRGEAPFTEGLHCPPHDAQRRLGPGSQKSQYKNRRHDNRHAPAVAVERCAGRARGGNVCRRQHLGGTRDVKSRGEHGGCTPDILSALATFAVKIDRISHFLEIRASLFQCRECDPSLLLTLRTAHTTRTYTQTPTRAHAPTRTQLHIQLHFSIYPDVQFAR